MHAVKHGTARLLDIVWPFAIGSVGLSVKTVKDFVGEG